MDDRRDQLKAIRDAVVAFTDSPLYEYRADNNSLPVIGQGDHFATVMMVGQAPSEVDAKTGRPFSGNSGVILDELLTSIGLGRDDIYLTNILKDTPPENRDPTKREINAYTPFLDQQIEIIQPQIIVPLGRFATRYILETFFANEYAKKISELHGTLIEVETSYGIANVMPMYHPAAAFYNEGQKKILLADFQKLKAIIAS